MKYPPGQMAPADKKNRSRSVTADEKMKKLIAVIGIITLFLGSCATYTLITGTWKSPSYADKSYNSILVASLTSNTVGKATIENKMEEQLAQAGIKASKSLDLFPPKMSDSDSDKVNIMKAVHGKKAEAILTVSIQKEKTETRYVPGYTYYPYSYGYYRDFWGYYSFWYPYTYTPGYYTEEKVYYLETNLYDSKTQELVWSAQSKTYESPNLPSFARDFAKEIVEKLKKEGLIKGASSSDDAFSVQ